ncbi:hypothetical protein ACH47Z_16295 [Streptomyces sp. NPDC020192]|uniref:hypothetical protein n=1 Tax=Streptomyces sp. NPDC020192 TaxID=3365066 RepID=UPI003793B343
MGERHTVPDTAGLEASLAAAIRTAPVDPDAEQRAVTAFRTARDAGPHRARTRRRDDWRPRRPGRLRLSVKATLSVFLASLTLGGVAIAAIGAADSSSGGGDHGDRRPAHPVTSAPRRAGAAAPSAHPDHPDTAKGRGKAHGARAERAQGKKNDDSGNRGNKSRDVTPSPKPTPKPEPTHEKKRKK